MSAGTARGTRHRLGPLEQIPPGEGRAFTVGDRAVAVFRPRGGELAATDAACPHRGGPLADGLVGAGVVVCPLHARRFSLHDGTCDIPGECAVAIHPVWVDDDGDIVVGARTSIQDGAIIHTTPFWPTTVGDECVVGHLAHLEGCTVEDGALVGSGSIVLHRAVVGSGALVGAGAVVSGDTVVPPRAMALGVPAKIRPDAVDPDTISLAMESYVQRTERYAKELRRID